MLGYSYLIPDRVFPKSYQLNDNIEVAGQDLKIIGFLEEIGNPQDDSNIYVSDEYYIDMNPFDNNYDQHSMEISMFSQHR